MPRKDGGDLQSNTQAIEIKNDGAVAWLTLNRPHNLNALSAQMVAELEDFLHRLPKQTETRVVVMKGAGRAFCAGLDLKEQNRGGTGLAPRPPTPSRVSAG